MKRRRVDVNNKKDEEDVDQRFTVKLEDDNVFIKYGEQNFKFDLKDLQFNIFDLQAFKFRINSQIVIRLKDKYNLHINWIGDTEASYLHLKLVDDENSTLWEFKIFKDQLNFEEILKFQSEIVKLSYNKILESKCTEENVKL